MGIYFGQANFLNGRPPLENGTFGQFLVQNRNVFSFFPHNKNYLGQQ
jgi:hypothetical protein